MSVVRHLASPVAAARWLGDGAGDVGLAGGAALDGDDALDVALGFDFSPGDTPETGAVYALPANVRDHGGVDSAPPETGTVTVSATS